MRGIEEFEKVANPRESGMHLLIYWTCRFLQEANSDLTGLDEMKGCSHNLAPSADRSSVVEAEDEN